MTGRPHLVPVSEPRSAEDVRRLAREVRLRLEPAKQACRRSEVVRRSPEETPAPLRHFAFLQSLIRASGYSIDDIMGRSRKAPLVKARMEMMADFYRRFPDAGVKKIGRLFHRDHSTVVQALRKAGVRP